MQHAGRPAGSEAGSRGRHAAQHASVTDSLTRRAEPGSRVTGGSTTHALQDAKLDSDCVMGLPAPSGPGLGLSGAAQTNRCCDQFVAREADGYKAEGFSRQRVLSNEQQ